MFGGLRVSGGTWVHLQGAFVYPAGKRMQKFRSMTQTLGRCFIGLVLFSCVCACVRVGLIETTLINWDIMHIVYYFQLLWKSQEIWPRFPGKQQSGWRTAICLDTVTRLSSPPSLPPIPFIFPTSRPLGSSFITVRGMLFVLL